MFKKSLYKVNKNSWKLYNLKAKYKKMLQHPLYKFINDICRWGNFNCIRILNRMAVPDDENEIYNSFNISQEEINFIESI